MKYLIKISLISSLLFVFGCSEGESENTNNELDTSTEGIQMEDRSTENPLENAANNTEVNENQNNSVKLNPAHGEPGHDCAIAVGAPLNDGSASANPMFQSKPEEVQNTQQPQIQQQNSPVQMQSPQGSTAKGLNPAHGQPGHDCSVAVGAPLNK